MTAFQIRGVIPIRPYQTVPYPQTSRGASLTLRCSASGLEASEYTTSKAYALNDSCGLSLGAQVPLPFRGKWCSPRLSQSHGISIEDLIMRTMDSHQNDVRLAKRLSIMLRVLLLIAACTAIYGHIGSPHLHVTVNYISDYAAAAYHWPWISFTMALFGVIYLLISFSIIHFSPQSAISHIGGMAFAMAGLCMFFVAHYPTSRNGHGIEIWDPTNQWKQGWDKAYHLAHFDMITASLTFLLTGICLSSIAGLRISTRSKHAKLSLIMAALMAILFVVGHETPQHGLFQRLGFVLNWAWLWITTTQIPHWIFKGPALSASPGS